MASVMLQASPSASRQLGGARCPCHGCGVSTAVPGNPRPAAASAAPVAAAAAVCVAAKCLKREVVILIFQQRFVQDKMGI